MFAMKGSLEDQLCSSLDLCPGERQQHSALTLTAAALLVMDPGAAWSRGHQSWRGGHSLAERGGGGAGPPGEAQQTPDSALPAEMQTADPEGQKRRDSLCYSHWRARGVTLSFHCLAFG